MKMQDQQFLACRKKIFLTHTHTHNGNERAAFELNKSVTVYNDGCGGSKQYTQRKTHHTECTIG